MIIHDKSTTISCNRCSAEYTVDGFLYGEKTMRRRAAKMGWTVVDGNDYCPKCSRETIIHNLFLKNGHFTADQLAIFKTASEEAIQSEQTEFTCPICNHRVSKGKSFGADGFLCTGCGVRYSYKQEV